MVVGDQSYCGFGWPSSATHGVEVDQPDAAEVDGAADDAPDVNAKYMVDAFTVWYMSTKLMLEAGGDRTSSVVD
jgi:hypothetical protein